METGYTSVKSLKKGDFFKLKSNSREVYIRGDYDRSERKYDCGAFSDISKNRYFPGEKQVFIAFEF